MCSQLESVRSGRFRVRGSDVPCPDAGSRLPAAGCPRRPVPPGRDRPPVWRGAALPGTDRSCPYAAGSRPRSGRRAAQRARNAGFGPSGRPRPEDLVTPPFGGNAAREGGGARQHGDHGARGPRHTSRQHGQRTVGNPSATPPRTPAPSPPVRAGAPPGQSAAGADRGSPAAALGPAFAAGNVIARASVGDDAATGGRVNSARDGRVNGNIQEGGRTGGAEVTAAGAARRRGPAAPPPGRTGTRRPPEPAGGPGDGSGRVSQRGQCSPRPLAFPRQRVLVRSRYGAATASIRNGCPIRPASFAIDRPRKGVPTRTPADWSRGGSPRARAGSPPDARRADVTDVGSGQESSP